MAEISIQSTNTVPVHRLYLGSHSGAAWKPLYRDAVISEAVNHFGNFTIGDVEGYWDGRSIPTLVLCIGTTDTARVKLLADVIGRITRQKEVGLEVNGQYQALKTNPN